MNSHKQFENRQHESHIKIKELSSLYVEIHESFLHTPLILTVLMETKNTPYHLSIEKEDNKLKTHQHIPSENISKILFAGKDHKGYNWMV